MMIIICMVSEANLSMKFSLIPELLAHKRWFGFTLKVLPNSDSIIIPQAPSSNTMAPALGPGTIIPADPEVLW